jgi:hypothetical protein
MKCTKVILGFAVLALGIASAATSYDVKLTGPTWIGATQMKAGEYKVEIQGGMAVFKSGKNVVEIPATMGTSEQKYSATSLSIIDSKLREIDFGGTKSKITFTADVQSAGTK